MFKLSIIVAASIALVGCASHPDSIPASFVGQERFAEMQCKDLSTQMDEAKKELTESSAKQMGSVVGDAIGVFLFLIPASKIIGDSSADVAKHKGQVEAIKTAQIKAKCV